MRNKITLLLQRINGFSKRKKILIFSGIGIFILLLILIPLSLSLSENRTKSEDTNITAPYVPDQIIIKYKKEVSPDLVFEQKIKQVGAISQESLYKSNDLNLSRYYLITFKKGTDIGLVRQKLEEFTEIDAADPNYIDSVQDSADDPYFTQEWGLSKIDITNAWSLGKGSSLVKVAVIDTGIDGSHPDLQGKVSAFVNCLSGSCTNTSAFDDFGHGTHVAGTIGAATNNSLGVSGINWEVSLLGVKVMASNGKGSIVTINQGIVYAADNGANVINMSLGGAHLCTSADQDAINYAIAKNVTVVVAAGNSTKDASGFSPASCQGVITVGASTSTDSRASFSNYGSKVDIAAPGQNILSLKSNICNMGSACSTRSYQSNYLYLDGTSMATPHVAGVAALLLSMNPDLAPSQVESCLVDNADQISTDRPIGPRLNAFKTLNNCSGLPPITGAPTATPNPLAPTPTPTPPPKTDLPYIKGTTFTDTNSNQNMDSGEPPISGVKVNLVQTNGSYSKSTMSDSGGNFYFPKINVGNYRLSVEYGSNPSIDIPNIDSGTSFDVKIGFPPSSVPTATPTPKNDIPTSTPLPTQRAGTPTPTPIVYQTANCVFDPSTCKSGQGGIQQCTLRCTPK